MRLDNSKFIKMIHHSFLLEIERVLLFCIFLKENALAFGDNFRLNILKKKFLLLNLSKAQAEENWKQKTILKIQKTGWISCHHLIYCTGKNWLLTSRWLKKMQIEHFVSDSESNLLYACSAVSFAFSNFQIWFRFNFSIKKNKKKTLI